MIGQKINYEGDTFTIITLNVSILQIWNEECDLVYEFSIKRLPQEITNQIF